VDLSAPSYNKFRVPGGRTCISLNYSGLDKLPTQNSGGLYKHNRAFALRFCRGLSVPCSSGRTGHFSFQIETLLGNLQVLLVKE
jgi:hypothetical protein